MVKRSSTAQIAFCFMAFPALSLADTIFTDGVFNLSDYASPFTIASGPMTGVVSQCSSCGDPGQALSAVFTLTTSSSASSNVDIGLLNTSFTYTPSIEGTIEAIQASVDNSTSPIFTPSYNLFLPLIEQNASFYEAEILSGPGNTGFVTLSSTLLASDFSQLDTSTGATNPGLHPNFAGDTMEFGLIVSDGSIALPSFTQTIVYDNLMFNLATVPEPGSLILMGIGLAGLLVINPPQNRQLSDRMGENATLRAISSAAGSSGGSAILN